MRPQLVLLAGPNGAGKSTFYELHLAGSPLPFVNADLVAAELGIDALEAARLVDASRERLVTDHLGFITETAFSDPQGHKLGMLRDAIAAGYDVIVVYIGLVTAKLSRLRVEQRVEAGGHDVPRDRIESRFERSLENLRAAIALDATVELYDNSSIDQPYRHLATLRAGAVVWRAPGRLPAWARRVMPARPRKRS